MDAGPSRGASDHTEDRPLKLLYEISKLFEGPIALDQTFEPILRSLATHLGLVRGTITLLKRDSKEVVIGAAYGLSPDEQQRGRYQLGEGVTGQVVASGLPVVISSLAEASRFLNRTGARDPRGFEELAFICVPIKLADEVLGALSVDRPAKLSRPLEDDVELLSIVAALLAQAVAARQAAAELEHHRVHERPPNILGTSKAMRPVFEMIDKVSKSNATVLIRGESGVGKELVAEAIHDASLRAGKPLIKVNCAALPASLLESELFGHEKGAFTNAIETRLGRFELADGGTIFLDEIGDFPPSTQITLLRILQQKEFERVGGSKTIRADVRIIAATNRDLESLITRGQFREDLYYRLNVFPIHVPALRERRTDVLLLADAFVEKFSRANDKDVRRISTQAIDMLMAYHWPGNVRELENCIERAVLLTSESVIHGHHLPPTLQTAVASGTTPKGTLESALFAVERDLIHDALKTARGNAAQAARALGLTERKMGLRIRRHRIDASRYRIEDDRS
jgi:Nif-specific regulatory protein